MRVVYLGSFATMFALIKEIESRVDLSDEIDRLAKQMQDMIPAHGVILESSVEELSGMTGNVLYKNINLVEEEKK